MNPHMHLRIPILRAILGILALLTAFGCGGTRVDEARLRANDTNFDRLSDYPKLGLDAFCQKVLVMQDAEGAVTIDFNDITALAQLHYGDSNLKHSMINRRIQSTLSKAISKESN